MTQLAVSIFVHDLEHAIRDIALAAEAGANIVELRVDQFHDLSLLGELLRRSLLPAIVTCRPVAQGGLCDLSDQERIPILEHASLCGASYIDVELESYRVSANLRQKVHFNSGRAIDATVPRERRCGLILSHHDVRSRPERLHNLVAELNASGADIHKIAWMARSVRDIFEVFELLLSRQRPTIALCMGESAIASRILAKKFGAFLSFASIARDRETAPGQPSVMELKSVYRWDAIREDTRVFGLVGDRIAYSMSPAVQNAAFASAAVNAVYVPFPVEKSYESFKAFVETALAFNRLDLGGLSVTIPHKQHAYRYIAEASGALSPQAVLARAVNTIVFARGEGHGVLSGHNTDLDAVLDALTNALKCTRQQLRERRFTVLGAGGTGRTAVAALSAHGASVTVYNRTRSRADELAAEFDGNIGVVRARAWEEMRVDDCDVLINTTSVGMTPDESHSPLDRFNLQFNARQVVMDVVYNPVTTRLIAHARSSGAHVITGRDVFLGQAARQFELFTGMDAPLEAMQRAFDQRPATASGLP